MSKRNHKNKYNSGVTLVELLVVIIIFMVISGITLFSYGKFNSSLSLQNLADDVALSVRKAQGYAISARGYGPSFIHRYGVHFSTNTNTSNLSAGSNKSFVLFSDIDNDEIYDYDIGSGVCGDPDQSECLEILNITSSDKITGVYRWDGNGDETLISPNGSTDIFFKRPNPEPSFCIRDDVDTFSCDYDNNDVTYVKIEISNDRAPGVYKFIYVYNNGQISVK
jgi:type II secretory pathway pseudopilin PulG